MLKKRVIVSTLILIPSILASAMGFTALSLVDRIPPGVEVGFFEAGGLNRTDFTTALENFYDSVVDEGVIKLDVNGNLYSIGYRDIELKIDASETYRKIVENSLPGTVIDLSRSYFLNRSRQIKPVFLFNMEKLLSRLRDIANKEEKKPRDARILLKNGRISKVGEVIGLKLDPEKVAEYIIQKLEEKFEPSIEITVSEGNGLVRVLPERTAQDFEGIEDIIAEYRTTVREKDLKSAQIAANALNGALVLPEDREANNGQNRFSFNERITRPGHKLGVSDNGYRQVASTLYAALLLSDIETGSIKKVVDTVWRDYISPGLNILAGEYSSDLTFRNTLGHPVAILAEIKGNELTVRIAGKKDPDIKSVELKIDIDQEYEPSVMYIEDPALKPGEQKLLSPGRKGLEISVYKIVTRKTQGTEQLLLYRQKYKAVDAVVKTGPNIKSPAKLK